MRLKIALSVIVALILPCAETSAYSPPPVSITSLDGSISFPLFGYDEVGGVNLELTDLGNDGVSEILVAGGLGSEPRVRVLRQDGSEIGSFLAYAPTMGVGINVIACDLTGDGLNEIITAPQRGGGPHVRVFNRNGEAIDNGGFFAYAQTLRTGVNLACGDLQGDEHAELVTLPAAGGGAHVRIWSWSNGHETLENNFFAFHASDRSGLVGVVDNHKLIVSQQFTSTPTIKTIVIHSPPKIINEKNFPLDGVGVSSINIFKEKIYLSTTFDNKLYDVQSETITTLDTPLRGIKLASDNNTLVYSKNEATFSNQKDEKRIEVDISKQRLFVYSNGILDNTFLISSGLHNSTPLGNHVISAKIPIVHYTWFYGSGSPLNYDLGRVPYNLRFLPHIYIHYAPWHNNFGNQMSHGCVNVALDDMKWLYEWAKEGIPVVVRE